MKNQTTDIIMVIVLVTGCDDIRVNLRQFIAGDISEHFGIQIHDDLYTVFSCKPEARLSTNLFSCDISFLL